eukprot:maker-scaffold112_size353035-snap-gene-0.8 protein:Tk07389 transcript:maker-scaffold112_size353035-snap-gene-0.8-mRNA-1 annotation:"39s ribosomal protein mitochondrial precursor"
MLALTSLGTNCTFSINVQQPNTTTSPSIRLSTYQYQEASSMNQAELQHLVSALRFKVLPLKLHKNILGPRGSLDKLRRHVTALIVNERIELPASHGDHTRLYTERLISDAVTFGDKHVHTMEMATWWLDQDRSAVHKLFKVLVPRFQDSRYSYTQMWNAPNDWAENPTYPHRSDGIIKVLELRGHPFPKFEYSNSRPNRNHIHNVLLSEAKKDFNVVGLAQALAEAESKSHEQSEATEGNETEKRD